MRKLAIEILRRPAETVAEIADILNEIQTALPDARAALQKLVDERRERLLVASDAELEKIERRVADARREVDRLEAAAEIVGRRHHEALAAEARAALDREKVAAETMAEKITSRLVLEYPRLAASIASIVADLTAAEAKITAVNEKLLAAGRGGECLAEIETTAIHFGSVGTRDAHRLFTCSLPPAGNFAGLGDAVARARIDGLTLLSEVDHAA